MSQKHTEDVNKKEIQVILTAYDEAYEQYLLKKEIQVIGKTYEQSVHDFEGAKTQLGYLASAAYAKWKKSVNENSDIRLKAFVDVNEQRKKIALTLLRVTFSLAQQFVALVGPSERLLVKRAPGTRLLQIVDFLCSPSNVEQVFEPLVADWQKEYFEALQQGRKFKARWISVRYSWRSVLALGLSKVFSLLRSFTSAKK